MGEKIVVGPFPHGLRNDVTAFNIDNTSFPTLINAYQWRGRVKRKRGTSILNRLARDLPEASIGNSGASPWTFNIYSVYTPAITPEPNASLVRGALVVTIHSSPEQVFTDNGNGTFSKSIVGTITNATQANPCQITSNGHGLSNGNVITIRNVGGMTQLNNNTYTITVVNANNFTLNGVNSTGFTAYTTGGTWTFAASSSIGSINYVTGSVTIVHTAGAGVATTASFDYYPVLPVMGLEDVLLNNAQFAGTLAFDTKYSYNVLTVDPYDIYDVTYYKNPATSTAYPGYIPKTTPTAFTWNGQNYQQFWTTNYQNSVWATNGVAVPFTITNVGMQFKPILTVTVTAGGPPAIVSLQITGHGLVVGDFVFINEVVTTTGINYQTGYVTVVTDANNVVVEFPNATIATNGTGGIAQYLTSSAASPTLDCIKWYDGDPTNGNPSAIGFEQGKGWVNFCPPLSNANLSIADLPPAKYYLVGCKFMLQFKDRMVAFGPVVQTSSVGSQIYLQDVAIWSQNGTPYYTSSFTGDPLSAATTFFPVLVPPNQTATAPSWFEDTAGFGGWKSPGLDEPAISASVNQDVLLVGYSTTQTRFVYSGNDLDPFDFFLIDSELGTTSTFSYINLGDGVITKGSRGYVYTVQVGTDRIDLAIPDEVFQVKLTNNGNERFTAMRDFINEWAYLTYPADNQTNIFNSQTLQYNYRDKTWAQFNESYTTYGIFRALTGFIWSTVGRTFPTWDSWDEPWNAGSSSLLKPKVIAGTTQGFVVFRDDGTTEAFTMEIKSFTGSTISSPNHMLSEGDFVLIDNCIGTISPEVNNKIFRVTNVSNDDFVIEPNIGTGTYIGGGNVKRIYIPFIQTKQFQVGWQIARKTRIGVQQYLLTKTDLGQIQLQMYLSQNADSFYNFGPIVPNAGSVNNSLIYSTVLYTCPESTNLGLTPANINLQTPTANAQSQIWHRKNTSLLGDTVQLGFSMSEEQVRALYPTGEIYTPITGITATFPAVITVANNLGLNNLVLVSGVNGMTELNGNTYNVLSSTGTTLTIDVDATGFTPYTSGGTLAKVGMFNQFSEIELHGFILDCAPSSLLA